MSAPPGNQFWKVRARSGRKAKYPKPGDEAADGVTGAEMLREDCLEYFEWNHDNPLYAAEKVTFQGEGSTFEVAKMRAMTLIGLCHFIGMSTQRQWRNWKNKDSEYFREDLLPVMKWAEEVIYRQKFEGASADMLNSNIIARDLGLADKSKLVGDKEDDPIQHNVSPSKKLSDLISSIAKRSEE